MCRQLVVLLHKPEVESSTVSNFVIDIVQTPGQQDIDAPLDLGVALAYAKLGESSDRSRTNDGILKDDSVVDVPDVLGGLGGLGPFHSEEMQDADREFGKFTVLNELAQVSERILLGVRHELDQIEHALHHGALELVAALVAQDAAQEGEHTSLLAGELEAQRADGFDNGNLELVRDLRHEAGNVLHKTIHAGFVAGLQESRDSKGRNGSVAVRDEELNIGVADIDGVRLKRGKVVEDAEGGELGDSARGGEEELKDVDRLRDLCVGDVSHVAYGLGGFEIDHLALMPQPAVQQLHHGFAQGRVIFGELCSQTDEENEGG